MSVIIKHLKLRHNLQDGVDDQRIYVLQEVLKLKQTCSYRSGNRVVFLINNYGLRGLLQKLAEHDKSYYQFINLQKFPHKYLLDRLLADRTPLSQPLFLTWEQLDVFTYRRYDEEIVRSFVQNNYIARVSGYGKNYLTFPSRTADFYILSIQNNMRIIFDYFCSVKWSGVGAHGDGAEYPRRSHCSENALEPYTQCSQPTPTDETATYRGSNADTNSNRILPDVGAVPYFADHSGDSPLLRSAKHILRHELNPERYELQDDRAQLMRQVADTSDVAKILHECTLRLHDAFLSFSHADVTLHDVLAYLHKHRQDYNSPYFAIPSVKYMYLLAHLSVTGSLAPDTLSMEIYVIEHRPGVFSQKTVLLCDKPSAGDIDSGARYCVSVVSTDCDKAQNY